MKQIVSQLIWPNYLVTTYDNGDIALIPWNDEDGIDLFPNDDIDKIDSLDLFELEEGE